MIIPVIPFDQPAGRFLLAVMNAADVLRISRVKRRSYDPVGMKTVGGVQRTLSEPRVTEIAEYAHSVDAAFPTPILLALQDVSYTLLSANQIELKDECVADVVDGQHRLKGLHKSGCAAEFIIPVVFILEPTEEQKALMFATINGKQTKVPASLIYDLFEVTATRSPQKTAHEIARALNSTPESAWYKRLKMLGTKTSDSSESLSQGTFVKQLLPLISKNADKDMEMLKRGEASVEYEGCIFNGYFRAGKDETILKILMNAFGAAKTVWPNEWAKPDDYIISKSVGFTAIMRALPNIYDDGAKSHNLSQKYFEAVFLATNTILKASNIALNSGAVSASGSGAGLLREKILEGLQVVISSRQGGAKT